MEDIVSTMTYHDPEMSLLSVKKEFGEIKVPPDFSNIVKVKVMLLHPDG